MYSSQAAWFPHLEKALPQRPLGLFCRREAIAPGSKSSILGTAPASQSQPVGGATPITPPTSGGVLDTLKKVDEQQGQQAPSGPQAPRSQ